MNEELIALKKDLDICITGNCSECKYWTKHCTDSLIDACVRIIGGLLDNVENKD